VSCLSSGKLMRASVAASMKERVEDAGVVAIVEVGPKRKL
jgi:hypothetical protein